MPEMQCNAMSITEAGQMFLFLAHRRIPKIRIHH